LPDKGEIELRDDLNDGAPLYAGCSPTFVEYRGRRWHATDGSGIVFISDNDNGVVNSDLAGALITGDGMRYRFVTIGGVFGRASSVTDRKGNQITINYSTDQSGKITTEYVDQLGRSTKVEQNAPDPANSSVILALLVTIKGYQGTPQYYRVKAEALSSHVRADFNYNGQQILTGYNDRFGYCYAGGQPPAANYLFTDSYCGYQERIDTKYAVSQIILPDGRSLQFSYNLYGEVAEVLLPTGGKLQYDYTGFTETGFPSGNTLAGEYQGQMNAVQNIDRAVTARRTYPDGITLEETSTYLFGSQTVNGSSSACTEVKAYAGTSGGTLLSDQRHFFLAAGRYLTGSHGSMSGTGYSLWSTGVEWRTEVLDAAGAVISASEQDWAQRTPVSWSSGYAQEQPANDNRVSEARRYLYDGSFAKTDTFYDNTN
jgi:YD repeat-containing protein